MNVKCSIYEQLIDILTSNWCKLHIDFFLSFFGPYPFQHNKSIDVERDMRISIHPSGVILPSYG